jgi:signal peptidase II
MKILAGALLVTLADYLSKRWATGAMAEGMSMPLIDGVFHITYVLNPGAAFGFLENQQGLFLVTSALLLGFFLYFLPALAKQPLPMQAGAALFAGGALGNLIDRVRFGQVVDFLDFRVWPVFNLADMAICAGAACILWNMLKTKQI